MLRAAGGGTSGITAGTTAITSGTDKRVLFDDNGVAGEDAGLTFDKTTDTLTVSGDVILGAANKAIKWDATGGNYSALYANPDNLTYTNWRGATAVVIVSPTTLGGDRNGLALASNSPLAWSSSNDTPSDPNNWDIALKRNAANVLEVVKSYTANDYGDLILRKVTTNPTTVASLPAAAAGLKGARAFVTDATATTFLSTVSGGGANNVPVVCDGSNWLIG